MTTAWVPGPDPLAGDPNDNEHQELRKEIGAFPIRRDAWANDPDRTTRRETE